MSRYRATAAEWRRFRAAKLDGCRVCGSGYAALTLHHLVSRSLGGDDVPANLVPLCGDGVVGCHGKVEAWDYEARSALRRSLTEEELDYAVGRKSEAWLDRYYPKVVADGVRDM